MQRGILKRSVLILLLTSLVVYSLQNPDETNLKGRREEELGRIKRATVRKPGFFRTLFSVVFEQWNDTRNTVGTVNRLINDNFLPENAPTVQSTTGPDSNGTTTEAPYRISRAEFNRILRRNLKGLMRLYNLELNDALKQSDKNYAEFRKNASIEVSKFL